MEKISSFVLKVASRCNLNCSYCYMYNLGDNTYLDQPKFMTIETIKIFVEKLKSYCSNNNIKFLQIVFHGGEPLLWGKKNYVESINIFKETLKNVKFDFALQTNGVTLTEDWCQLLKSLDIRIGISMDGPKIHHDKYRVFHSGKGSYNKVINAINIGKKYNLNNILSVVNLEIRPEEFYDEIKKTGVQNFNLLLPDGHFDNLPNGFDIEKINTLNHTPYADWLIKVFDLWKKDTDRPMIRYFLTLIYLIMGDEVGDQMLGKLTNGVAVLETNGALEVSDSIRASYEGITRNDLNIYTHNIEDLHNDPLFEVYFKSHNLVSEDCINCQIYEICGGGFLGNRYSNKKGFNNPAIYCHDTIKLVTYIENDLLNSFEAGMAEQLELEYITYEEILQGNEKRNLKIHESVKQKLEFFKYNA